MSVDLKMVAFRERSALQVGDAPWVSHAQQSGTWKRLFDLVGEARAHGLSPVICVDLDLTTLLVPQKSRDVLAELASSAVEFDTEANAISGIFAATLEAIWCGAQPALLPGYTTTSIQAYGIYCAAQLQARTGQTITAERLTACEEWIAAKIYAKLRSGYWDRDLSHDELAVGFAQWAHRVAVAGARIVFLSNRDPSLREVSLDCIARLLGDGVKPFAFFGPGGSPFDVTAKVAAVKLIELGVTEGIHLGVVQEGQVTYLSTVPDGSPQTILAVIDDRGESRRQIIDASIGSAERLTSVGLGGIMDIASAAQGFCPEVDVVNMSTVISSFVIEENV